MKKYIAIFLTIVSLNAWATVRTVCNMPYSPGQYTTFAAAHTACNVNDTIYVHGSSINYGAISVSKSGIVVIGTGHNPNKQVPLTSNFTTITCNAFYCKFIGLTFENMTTCAYTTIKRCKILGNGSSMSGNLTFSMSADNSLIEGNVFTGATTNINFSGLGTTNTIVRNNIFNAGLGYYAINGNSSITTTNFSFMIVNNLFLGTASTFLNIYNAIIDNNVFYRSSPVGASIGCTMSNNISYMCTTNTFSATGANNLTNVNPMFVNFPTGGANFAYTHDYHFASGSPCIATGTDGTDKGVYGGFGYKFNMTGEPAMPEITEFSITSPTVIAPGGTLTISVKSKRIK